MIDKNYGMCEIKIQYLKKLYKSYTDHIINLESHINRLHNELIIDVKHRNNLFQKIDSMIRILIKTYNLNLMNSYQNIENSYFINKKEVLLYEKINKEIELINLIEKNEKIDIFDNIKHELLLLIKDNGYKSINKFFKLYFGNKFKKLFDESIIEKYKLYNKVFIPMAIMIDSSDENNDIFNVERKYIECDSLIDNTCCVTIHLSKIKKSISFVGYVHTGKLGIYLRTCQIYSDYLFDMKKETKKIIEKEYLNVDINFVERYLKLINNNLYFVNDQNQIALKISDDYELFKNICKKNFNNIMKNFIQSDILQMYTYINLLLMGDKQNINSASILFDLLKDKKISNDMLSNMIYDNLSFYSQIRLRKMSRMVKHELLRIKSLTFEKLPIEKKLAGYPNMPDNVKTYIIEKNNEMTSGENAYKLQIAINGLINFPWKPLDHVNEYSEINKSMHKSREYLQNVAKKLNENVFGHEHTKKTLIELVGKWIQNPESAGQVIGLVGPPGIGKTLLAKSISYALDIPMSIIGLGGMSDSADLIGHSFTYTGSQYGMIIRQMIKVGHWRSILFFDEVDKTSKRNDTNEIYNTLIHITDPNMNQHFQDRFYSSIDFDLSGVLIVFSYNDADKLNPILRDRIKEIRISQYSIQEKISIAKNYIMKELCSNIGFNQSKILIHDSDIKYIIEQYTAEAGVRDLRRKFEQILLKLNIDRFYMRGPFHKLVKKKCAELHPDFNTFEKTKEKLDSSISEIESYVAYTKTSYETYLGDDILNNIFNMQNDNEIIIDNNLIHKYLEKPTNIIEKISLFNYIGVINGLYATSVGIGGIVPIQIYRNYTCIKQDNNKFKLHLTGNLKKIMKESIMCALTTAINLVNKDIRNNIKENFPNGFHIHAPDGGTPKDGPSAGAAFTTAFVSILLGKKINREIAMTGEIELTGKVTKIGGLDMKLSGARLAGIKHVYICKDNEDDYQKIIQKNPELIENDLKIHIITHILDIVTNPNIIIDVTYDDFDPSILSEYKKN